MDFFSDGEYWVLFSTPKMVKHWCITVDQAIENTADWQGEPWQLKFLKKTHIYNLKKTIAFHIQELQDVFN